MPNELSRLTLISPNHHVSDFCGIIVYHISVKFDLVLTLLLPPAHDPDLKL